MNAKPSAFFPSNKIVWLLCIALLQPGLVLGAESSSESESSAEPIPQPQAHAHNDYAHERPLLDALAHGFCSVEADVFAIDGELRVAHDRVDTRPGKTLEKLYLDPLRARVKANGGRVYREGPAFFLLIDFKSDGEPTYKLLGKVLANYRDLLVPKNKGERAAVSVVVSGNRPFDLAKQDKQRLCGLDGRLGDLDSDRSSVLMPLISDNWRSHFKWRGEGEIPVAEKEKLTLAVKKAHDAGRRIRFWATPENENVWAELAAAGVDHINTDQLARLQKFLLTQPAATR